jgi:HAD superfamily hydrolase (TIGR01509 family)
VSVTTRLLVWDFDGTLADTFPAIRASCQHTLAAHGYGPVDDAVLRASGGLALPEVLTRVAGDPAPDPEALVAMIATYREVFPTHAVEAVLFPGVAAYLADLGDRGVTSAIATGRRRASTVELLDRFGLAGRFATVHCEDDLPPGRGKPLPDLALAACAAVGRPPGDAVVIGDSPHDVAMGRAAGATTVAATWGHDDPAPLRASGADHVVDDLAALTGVLAGLG